MLLIVRFDMRFSPPKSLWLTSFGHPFHGANVLQFIQLYWLERCLATQVGRKSPSRGSGLAGTVSRADHLQFRNYRRQAAAWDFCDKVLHRLFMGISVSDLKTCSSHFWPSSCLTIQAEVPDKLNACCQGQHAK